MGECKELGGCLMLKWLVGFWSSGARKLIGGKAFFSNFYVVVILCNGLHGMEMGNSLYLQKDELIVCSWWL